MELQVNTGHGLVQNYPNAEVISVSWNDPWYVVRFKYGTSEQTAVSKLRKDRLPKVGTKGTVVILEGKLPGNRFFVKVTK